MPEIVLDLAQTVAVGAFNPHIVEPRWLIKQKIRREVDFLGIDFMPGTDEDEEVFRFGNEEWQVDYTRLAVTTRDFDASKKAVQAITKVLEKLPHTPVKAVGHNFHFSCTLAEWEGYPVPQLGEVGSPGIGGHHLVQNRWSGIYEIAKSRVEVSVDVAAGQEIVVFLFNHERRTEPGDCDAALEALRTLSDDIKLTKRIFQDWFNIRI